MKGENVVEELTLREREVAQLEYNSRKKSYIIAYLLWLFLGVFGVHRFYLGNNISGFLQLSLFVLGTLTTFLFIGYIFLAILSIWLVGDLVFTAIMVSSKNNKIKKEIASVIVQSR